MEQLLVMCCIFLLEVYTFCPKISPLIQSLNELSHSHTYTTRMIKIYLNAKFSSIETGFMMIVSKLQMVFELYTAIYLTVTNGIHGDFII